MIVYRSNCDIVCCARTAVMEMAAHHPLSQTLYFSLAPAVSQWVTQWRYLHYFVSFSIISATPIAQDASKEEEYAFTCRKQHQEATEGYWSWYENEDH